MKTLSLLRPTLWCLVLGVALMPATPTLAQQPQGSDPFKIYAVRTYTSSDLIKVGSAWRKDLPKRIQATLRVEADTPASEISVKAYFYDHDSHLIGTTPKPNLIWTETPRGVEEVGLPKILTHIKNTDVYFAIPDDAAKKNWTTVLIVFGNKTKMVASANPATAIAKLDFPEKTLVEPAATPGL